MKLTKKALQKINNPHCIGELMIALGFTELWIKRLISDNRANGPLTTYAALRIIKKETGLGDDQILEASKPKRVARASAL